MPLTYEERRRLNDCLNGMTAPAVMGDTDGGGSGIDALCASVSRLLSLVTPVVERALNEPETLPGEAPATDAPRRRGRKPAAGADGVAAAPAPGATAPTSAPASIAQSVGQVAQPDTHQTADLGGFADDPLDEKPAAGNGEAIPGFLDRNAAKAAPAPAPAPKVYTPQEVKEVLKRYMDKKGATGTDDLTKLLVAVGGVKKFAELDPTKFGEIIARAKADAGLA